MIDNTLNQTISNIKKRGVPEHECWRLLSLITNQSHTELILNKNFSLNDQQQLLLDDFIHQLTIENKPIQYIEGIVDFCGLSLYVEPPILIPRPETEEWTNWLIKKLHKKKEFPLTLLDMCTGSGCIGLSIAYHCPWITVVGADHNPQALSLAQRNKKKLNLSNISFTMSSFFDNLKNKKFDCIVANPPYITNEEYKTLDPRVKLWEDKTALVTPEKGVYSYSKIFTGALHHLEEKSPLGSNFPRIIVELGTQSDLVADCFEKIIGTTYKIFSDEQGALRWLAGRYLTK